MFRVPRGLFMLVLSRLVLVQGIKESAVQVHSDYNELQTGKKYPVLLSESTRCGPAATYHRGVIDGSISGFAIVSNKVGPFGSGIRFAAGLKI